VNQKTHAECLPWVQGSLATFICESLKSIRATKYDSQILPAANTQVLKAIDKLITSR